MTQFQYNPNHQDLPDQQVDAGLAASNCLRLYERAMREIEAGKFEDAEMTCDEVDALWLEHIAARDEVRVYAMQVCARSALLNWKISRIIGGDK